MIKFELMGMVGYLYRQIQLTNKFRPPETLFTACYQFNLFCLQNASKALLRIQRDTVQIHMAFGVAVFKQRAIQG